MTRGRTCSVFVVLGPLLALVGSACGAGAQPPGALLDGTSVERPPVDLEGVERRPVMTETQVLNGSDPRVRACLDQRWSEPPRAFAAVVRTGVDGRSVTLGDGRRRGVYACDGDNADGAGKAWCGVAFGDRSAGRLRDPRLDLGGCATAKGRALAFAWVEPGPRTRYVVVRRDGFAEAYAVAAGLPVRVATTDVDLERSRATFEMSEHDATGRALRRYELRAETAG